MAAVSLGDMNADTVVMFSLDDVDFDIEMETQLDLVPWSGVRPKKRRSRPRSRRSITIDAPN